MKMAKTIEEQIQSNERLIQRRNDAIFSWKVEIESCLQKIKIIESCITTSKEDIFRFDMENEKLKKSEGVKDEMS